MRPLGGIVKPYSVGLSGGLAEVALELRVHKRPVRLAPRMPPLVRILVERPIDDFKSGRRNMWGSLAQGIADSFGKATWIPAECVWCLPGPSRMMGVHLL